MGQAGPGDGIVLYEVWRGGMMGEPCYCGAEDCPRCYPEYATRRVERDFYRMDEVLDDVAADYAYDPPMMRDPQ